MSAVFVMFYKNALEVMGMKVGEHIIQLREARGWTTNRLANQCGLSQSFLRSVEMGEKSISVDNLEIMCHAMGIELKTFFDLPSEKDSDLDRLNHQIKLMTSEQRTALLAFLKTLPGIQTL